jgi:hypothetical protein
MKPSLTEGYNYGDIKFGFFLLFELKFHLELGRKKELEIDIKTEPL